MAKFEWKVWLRPNVLTDNPTDYVAEVDTAGHTRLQNAARYRVFHPACCTRSMRPLDPCFREDTLPRAGKTLFHGRGRHSAQNRKTVLFINNLFTNNYTMRGTVKQVDELTSKRVDGV